MVVTLLGRGVGCLAKGLPLGCEVVFERGVWYSLCCNKSSSVGDSELEILHGGEGGDVARGSNLETYLVFAFDPLSLNSLYLCCA